MNRFGISSALFSLPTVNDWQIVKEAGFDSVELSLPIHITSQNPQDYIDFIRKIAIDISDAGLEFWTLHIPFDVTFNFCSVDDEIRKNSVAKTIDIIKGSYNLGYKTIVIHSGAEIIDKDKRQLQLDNCRKSIKELTDLTDSLNLNLALENLPRACIGNTSQEVAYIINDTNCKVCFDVNHLINETHEHFFEVLGDKIITTHLSDYDGIDECHWLPQAGIINWKQLIEGFKNVNYDGPFLFEIGYRRFPVDKIPTPLDVITSFKTI